MYVLGAVHMEHLIANEYLGWALPMLRCYSEHLNGRVRLSLRQFRILG